MYENRVHSVEHRIVSILQLWLRPIADVYKRQSYGWKTAHKKVGYVGLWSFESAALAKILALNDEKLKSSSHYPYDLAHYKSNKRFSVKAIETVEKNRRKDETGEGIVSNRELECIVPAQFQNMVNTCLLYTSRCV